MENNNDKDMNVREMTAGEAENYSGITIDEPSSQQTEQTTQQQQRPYTSQYRPSQNTRIFRSTRNKTASPFSWQSGLLMRVALVVGAMAVATFLVFIALPVLIVVAGVAVAAWVLLQILQG